MRTSSAVVEPRLGDTVLGCFRLERVIGAGSFATAYLAEQLGTDRLAVVKLPHPALVHGPRGPELRRRFEAEAKAATRARHPNLVTVYLVGETHYGIPAIAMEYVAGESLNDRLLRCAPLATPELIALGEQLADVLAALHAAGVVHRDLSPANVLVNERGDGVRIKLLDFGVAKLLDMPSRTLGPMGTPGYLAPEQLLGSVTPRADVFSLGAVLWWAITGHERADDFSDGSLRESLGRTVGPDPRAVRADAPPAFAELISRALVPDPERRPTTAEFLVRWREAAAARRPPMPAHERQTTAQTDAAARTAVVIPEANMRAAVSSFLRRRGGVYLEHPDARELGRASPGAFDVAILGEALPVVGTRRFVEHLRACYPELTIIVVGFDEGRRALWLDVGADGFVHMPDALASLGDWFERGFETLTTNFDASARLHRSLIDARLARDPIGLAAELEAFIGRVPQRIAAIEHDLDRDACRALARDAESVGAASLARLARAIDESLATGDLAAARTFLAASEREYAEVFRIVFSLMDQITKEGAAQ